VFRTVVTRYPLLGATALLIALTIILTWPQFLFLGSKVADHGDPLLSIWRVSWIAHVLPGDVRHLFDTNIFHPHPRTLAYSDATLLEGLIALPLLWANANPVLVYNLLLLGGIVSSGVGMFVLVRHLTGSVDAALVSAAIFTLAPYRICIMHLGCSGRCGCHLVGRAPCVRHRIVSSGRHDRRALVSASIVLLMPGAFLGLMVGCRGAADLAAARRTVALGPLGVGAILAIIVTAAYARPYHELAGPWRADPGRSRPSVLNSPATSRLRRRSWLWGWTASVSRRRASFVPGLVPIGWRFCRLRESETSAAYVDLRGVGRDRVGCRSAQRIVYWLHTHVGR
jgi:hypothetical protein